MRDPDGIRVFEQPASRRMGRGMAIAAGVGILAVVVAVTRFEASRRPPAAAGERAAAAGERTVPPASPATPSPAIKKVVRAPSAARPAPAVAATEHAREAAAAGGAPTTGRSSGVRRRADRSLEGLVRDAYQDLAAHGDGEGIAAFPPKGTNPVKTGVIVPEDFQLPEGYVRYYQTTDEGQRLEAILMFSPDYEFVDASGKKIELPANGIVPPEMAPPGMPVRMLEIPADPDETGSGR